MSMAVSIPKKNSSNSGPNKSRLNKSGYQINDLSPILAPSLQGPMGEPPEVEVVMNLGNQEFLESWDGLLAECVDENPFMSPMFIIPAMAHLCSTAPLALVATWQTVGKTRHLTGLFPVASPRRQTLRGWLFGGKTELWTHELVPFNAPLLSPDPDIAEASVSAFIDWMSARRPRLSNIVLPMMLDGSQAISMFETEFARHGFEVQRKRDDAHTRGLNFKPSNAPAVSDKVVIARNMEEIKRDLEKALCMDSLLMQSTSAGLGILGDLDISSFLRAVVRGFAARGEICIAHIDQPDAKASAIVIHGRKSAFLWWIMGPDARNPMIEASLSSAVEIAIGKRIIAATATPVSGLWAEPISTKSFSVNVFAG
jgi:hypothetical protein